MRRRWFAEHCATVLGRFRATRPAHATASSPKRRRTSTPQDPAEFRTVADCYALKNSNTDEHKLQCHLIHAPKAVRVIDGRNKMNGQTEKTSVLNIVVADHTGPLHVDLWGSVGEKFLQDVAAAAEQSDEPLPLEISYFFVRRDTRLFLLNAVATVQDKHRRSRTERRSSDAIPERHRHAAVCIARCDGSSRNLHSLRTTRWKYSNRGREGHHRVLRVRCRRSRQQTRCTMAVRRSSRRGSTSATRPAKGYSPHGVKVSNAGSRSA